MKLRLFCIILCCLLAYCNNDKHSGKHQQESPTAKTLLDSFKHHFKILDSIVQQHPLDTLYKCCTSSIPQCCTPSIDFMDEKTEIEPSSHANFMGRLYFTKKDWEKWHEWYDKKYGKNNN